MLDEAQLADTLRVVRPTLKGYLRRTRDLLAVLMELEKDLDRLVTSAAMRQLDERIAEEAKRNGKTERQVKVG